MFVLLIFFTAALLVIANGWRLAFVLLGAQYLSVAWLMFTLADWPIAVVKAMTGIVVLMMLVLTAVPLRFGDPAPVTLDEADDPAPRPPLFEFSTNAPFRIMAVILAALAAFSFANTPAFAFPALEVNIVTASYLLMALGLLNLGLTEEPMNALMGLLTVLMGFELLYLSVQPALAVVALLAAVHFGLTLSVSYLVTMRYRPAELPPQG